MAAVNYKSINNRKSVGELKANIRQVVKNTDGLLEALTQTGAIIAGGFVLGSINRKLNPGSDIDIYVSETSYLPLLKFLNGDGTGHHYSYGNISSPYDTSFFKRNGINIRLSFDSPKIDLLIIKEGRTPQEVASNFDLTFCEVWYDASKDDIYGTFIEEALASRGYLRKSYMEVFLLGNVFTMRRVRKYISRGYQISFESPVISHEYFIGIPRSIDIDQMVASHCISMMLSTSGSRMFSSERMVNLLLKYPKMASLTMNSVNEALIDMITKLYPNEVAERVNYVYSNILGFLGNIDAYDHDIYDLEIATKDPKKAFETKRKAQIDGYTVKHGNDRIEDTPDAFVFGYETRLANIKAIKEYISKMGISDEIGYKEVGIGYKTLEAIRDYINPQGYHMEGYRGDIIPEPRFHP